MTMCVVINFRIALQLSIALRLSIALYKWAAFPIPLYILVIGGCYSLACLQSSWLILSASYLFIPIILFEQFSLLLLLLPLLLLLLLL